MTSSSNSDDENTDPHLNNNNDNSDNNSIPKNITELAEKKVRLAKAQAEIDRILNSPVDPPFDAESELKKVVSISPPLVAEGSAEYALEEQVSHMEHALYNAVKQTDFAQAAKHSSAISQLHIDDCGSVLQVNSKFYSAFRRKDLEDMQQVWLADRSCICIHPSQKPLVGIQAIQTSWDRMFQKSEGSFQRNWMEPQEIRLTVKATTAIVTCEEHVYARRFIRGQKRQTELVNKLQATNIFRKVGGRWLMTYHHSSWHADSDAAKQALKKQQGGSRRKKSSSSRRGSNNDDDDDDDTEIDNILGVNNFGPLLGDDSVEPEGKPVKRVIMGSLADILNGNLGGLLGDDENNSDNINNNDKKDHNEIGSDGMQSGEIHFNRMDDDDDDDEEEDVESLEELKEWVKKDEKKGALKVAASKDGKRQECIAALRKLSKEGRISPKQKQVLLTDIISCSAKKELSMVEVAYELLCSSKGEDTSEDAEEEFADQCIVFARAFAGET